MADKDINIRISTEAQVEGVQEAAAAVEELAGQQSAAAEATREMDEAAEQSDGFKKLFDQQRLQAIGKEVEKLGGTIGELVEGLKETQAGQDFFDGLSDEAKLFGGIAAEVGTSVVQGWAEGGPIGAALAGLNVLVKEVGDSFLAVARAEEQAAADLTAEMDRLTKQTRERQQIAADRAVEDTFNSENDALDRQNANLERQNELLDARRERQEAERDLKDQQDLAGGTSEEEIRIRKISADAEAEALAISEREEAARIAAAEQRARTVALDGKVVAVGQRDGTNSDEYRDAYRGLEEERAKLYQADADALQAPKIAEEQRRALEARTATRLEQEALRNREQAARDSARRAQDEAREQAREDAEGRRTATQRSGLGRQGQDIAGRAAGSSAVNPRQAAALERMGDDLAANPTAAGADQLGSALEKLANNLVNSKADESRKFREMARKVERLEAELTKIKTP